MLFKIFFSLLILFRGALGDFFNLEKQHLGRGSKATTESIPHRINDFFTIYLPKKCPEFPV
jgi:hypothetical protein